MWRFISLPLAKTYKIISLYGGNHSDRRLSMQTDYRTKIVGAIVAIAIVGGLLFGFWS